MATQRHIVKRQVLDIRLKNRHKAFQIQNQLSVLNHTKITDVLDEVCSQVASAERFIQLGRIEIDLGTLSLANLDEEFTERVRRRFHEELTQAVDLIPHDPPNVIRAPTGVAEAEASTPQGLADPPDQIVSAPVHDRIWMQHFLTTGMLPWWAEGPVTFDLLEKRVYAQLDGPEPEWQGFIHELQHENVRRRLVYQFSDRLLVKMMQCIAPDMSYAIQDFIAIFQHTPYADNTERSRLVVWDVLLKSILLHQRAERSGTSFFQSVMRSLAEHLQLQVQALVLGLQEVIEQPLSPKFAFRSELPKWISTIAEECLAEQQRSSSPTRLDDVATPHRHPAEKRPIAGTVQDRATQEVPRLQPSEGVRPSMPRETGDIATSRDQPPARRHAPDENSEFAKKEVRHLHAYERVRPPSPHRQVPDRAVRAEDEGTGLELDVDNAGLVLLWPFLSPFFRNLSLLEQDKGFVDDAANMRAVHLLQYLVTVEHQTPEYFLVLNKLLCGWDIAKPVIRGAELSSKEKSESEDLLLAVIAHWSVLKNTSVAGFRTAFLQRNGRLAKESGHWLLRVERKDYDLLLERLPWSLSMIKLSWMTSLLRVEW